MRHILIPAALVVAGLGLVIFGMSIPATTTGLTFILTIPPGFILIFTGLYLYQKG